MRPSQSGSPSTPAGADETEYYYGVVEDLFSRATRLLFGLPFPARHADHAARRHRAAVVHGAPLRPRASAAAAVAGNTSHQAGTHRDNAEALAMKPDDVVAKVDQLAQRIARAAVHLQVESDKVADPRRRAGVVLDVLEYKANLLSVTRATAHRAAQIAARPGALAGSWDFAPASAYRRSVLDRFDVLDNAAADSPCIVFVDALEATASASPDTVAVGVEGLKRRVQESAAAAARAATDDNDGAAAAFIADLAEVAFDHVALLMHPDAAAVSSSTSTTRAPPAQLLPAVIVEPPPAAEERRASLTPTPSLVNALTAPPTPAVSGCLAGEQGQPNPLAASSTELRSRGDSPEVRGVALAPAVAAAVTTIPPLPAPHNPLVIPPPVSPGIGSSSTPVSSNSSVADAGLVYHHGLTQAEVESLVSSFYSRHNPEKLPDVAHIVRAFAGKYDELFNSLNLKYLNIIPASLRSQSDDSIMALVYDPRLTTPDRAVLDVAGFYSLVAPEKVQDAQAVVARHKDDLGQLYRLLNFKYLAGYADEQGADPDGAVDDSEPSRSPAAGLSQFQISPTLLGAAAPQSDSTPLGPNNTGSAPTVPAATRPEALAAVAAVTRPTEPQQPNSDPAVSTNPAGWCVVM
jgi:hypothetical protein